MQSYSSIESGRYLQRLGILLRKSLTLSTTSKQSGYLRRMAEKDSVTLVSKDGEEFIVTDEEARASEMIALLLDSKFREAVTRRVELKEFDAKVVAEVVKVSPFLRQGDSLNGAERRRI